jgi:AcrR family transcriptional regulator
LCTSGAVDDWKFLYDADMSALSPPEREALEHLIDSPTTTGRQAVRARIVLMAAGGAANAEIAERASVSLPTVALWRRRYAERGIEGLVDQPRSGRPRLLAKDDSKPEPSPLGASKDGTDESLERLLAAAVRAISRRGYAATRVADIAEEAGVSPATVHYHLRLRQEILVSALLWAHERLIDELERAIAVTDDPVARLAMLIERTIPYPGVQKGEYLLEIDLWSQVRPHPELLGVWERYNNRWIGHVTAMIDAGISSGVFTCNVDAGEIAERLVAMTDGLAAQAAIGADRMPAARVREIVLRFTAEQLGVEMERLEQAAHFPGLSELRHG